jgi:ribosome-binding protein aMBF1 (putative translation factor)
MRDDLDRYISKRKVTDKGFAEGFDSGYQEFKIGHLLRNARKKSGMTQDELARRLRTTKSAISRIENHAEGVRVSTLKKVADALGKQLKIAIS